MYVISYYVIHMAWDVTFNLVSVIVQPNSYVKWWVCIFHYLCISTHCRCLLSFLLFVSRTRICICLRYNKIFILFIPCLFHILTIYHFKQFNGIKILPIFSFQFYSMFQLSRIDFTFFLGFRILSFSSADIKEYSRCTIKLVCLVPATVLANKRKPLAHVSRILIRKLRSRDITFWNQT